MIKATELPVWEEPVRIHTFDVGPDNRATAPALGRYLQEAASRQAASLGFGYDSLGEDDLFWVLSRLAVEVYRYPLWNEELNLFTWPAGLAPPYALRSFRLISSSGDTVAEAGSAWLTIESSTRRPRRVETVVNAKLYDQAERVLADRLTRIRLPERATPEPATPELGGKESQSKRDSPTAVPPLDNRAPARAPAPTQTHAQAPAPAQTPAPTRAQAHAQAPTQAWEETRRVRPSDLDGQNHTNNMTYLEWILDGFNGPQPSEFELKSFRINFLKETHNNDLVELWYSPLETLGDEAPLETLGDEAPLETAGDETVGMAGIALQNGGGPVLTTELKFVPRRA